MAGTKTMKQFNVLLDPEDQALLEELAKHTRQTKAVIIRDAIRSRHQMTFNQRPHCANGDQCRCPQFHAYGLPQAPPQPQPYPNPNNALSPY